MGILNDILDGFDNQAVMASTFKDLIEVLHDPELPFAQATSALSALSGRMPGKLEEGVRAAIESAKAKAEGAEFPAVRIKKLLDHFVEDNVRPQDLPMFRTQLSALFELVEKYLGGLKDHEVDTLGSLLARYADT